MKKRNPWWYISYTTVFVVVMLLLADYEAQRGEDIPAMACAVAAAINTAAALMWVYVLTMRRRNAKLRALVDELLEKDDERRKESADHRARK